jgi:hypothetical protein
MCDREVSMIYVIIAQEIDVSIFSPSSKGHNLCWDHEGMILVDFLPPRNTKAPCGYLKKIAKLAIVQFVAQHKYRDVPLW